MRSVEWVIIGVVYVLAGFLALLRQLRKRAEVTDEPSIIGLFVDPHPISLLQLLLFWPLFFAIESFDRYCWKKFRDDNAHNHRKLAEEQTRRESRHAALRGQEGITLTVFRPHGTVAIGDERLNAKSACGLLQPGIRVRITQFDASHTAWVEPL